MCLPREIPAKLLLISMVQSCPPPLQLNSRRWIPVGWQEALPHAEKCHLLSWPGATPSALTSCPEAACPYLEVEVTLLEACMRSKYRPRLP